MASGEPNNRRLVVWMVLVCLIAAAGTAYGVARFMNGSETNAPVAAEQEEERQEVVSGATYDMGTFTVDLLPDAYNSARLIRVTVVLQAVDRKAVRLLGDRDIQVKHITVATLRNRTASSLTGREGMQSLGAELRAAINSALGGEVVTSVYFPDLVMQ